MRVRVGKESGFDWVGVDPSEDRVVNRAVGKKTETVILLLTRSCLRD